MSHIPQVVLLILLLLTMGFMGAYFSVPEVAAQNPDSFPLYVGVDVAIGDLEQTKQLIDNISAFTNFFIIGCSYYYNTTTLSIISDYVYDKGLSFIVYSDDPRYPTSQWLQYANTTYGEKFMGIYFYDEAGGKQLDQAKYPAVISAANYSDAASQFVTTMNWWLGNNSFSATQGLINNEDYHFYTSDYAFYWWDYQAGYDTVFAEFGERGGNWTYSRQLNVALCRGASTVYDRDWGIMITWSTFDPPYMESGAKLYNDMILAYQNGAKYIVVFDSNENYTQNVLQQEHLNAMKQFWEYVQNNPRTEYITDLRTAAVLPEDYAYGFRGPTDKIWGLWQADELTINISSSVLIQLELYGGSLDLIYPSTNQDNLGYNQVINWNEFPEQIVSPVFSYYERAIYLWVIGISTLVVLAVAVLALTLRNSSSKEVHGYG
jgi:hypothetical protein